MFKSVTLSLQSFLLLTVVPWLTLLSAPLKASTEAESLLPQTPEVQKAVFVFNIARYIHWPDLSERDQRHQITLCLQSDSKSADVIDDLAKKYKIGERQLTVQVRDLDKNARCDLIYLEAPGVLESHMSKTLVDNLSREVVMVAAHADLYPDVSAITFYQHKKRLRVEVNMNIINRLKVDVSSELLKLARIRQIPDKQDGAAIQGGERE